MLTRHHDGKKFVVGQAEQGMNVSEKIAEEARKFEYNFPLPPMYDKEKVQSDIHRFGVAMSDETLDENKNKR